MPGQTEQLLVPRYKYVSPATGRQFEEFLVVCVAAAGQYRHLASTGIALDDETGVVLQQGVLSSLVKLELRVGGDAFELGEARRIAETEDVAAANGMVQPARVLVLKVQHVHDDVGVEDDMQRLMRNFVGHM